MRLARANVPPIYALTDASAGLPADEIVARLVEEGIHWIQARADGLHDADALTVLERAVAHLPAEVRLLVDHRIDLAVAAEADGVHLGDRDLSPGIARRICGGDSFIVGVSVHSVEGALAAAGDSDVDYVSIGPIFQSKILGAPGPLGLDAIERARKRIEKPIVAFGGITASNARSVIEAGADTVAVVSALYCRGSLRDNVRRLKEGVVRQ